MKFGKTYSLAWYKALKKRTHEDETSFIKLLEIEASQLEKEWIQSADRALKKPRTFLSRRQAQENDCFLVLVEAGLILTGLRKIAKKYDKLAGSKGATEWYLNRPHVLRASPLLTEVKAAARQAGDVETHCPICCEVFYKPMLLQCGHALCTSCVERCQESYKEDGSVRRCPMCRATLNTRAVKAPFLANLAKWTDPVAYLDRCFTEHALQRAKKSPLVRLKKGLMDAPRA